MRFSLVVATLGRTCQLERLFESLDAQLHRDFEVILVDQNPDDRLVPLAQAFAGRMDIKHLRQSPGTSRARNSGVRACTGDVIGFPDDDCWYGGQVLSKVSTLLTAHASWHGVIGDAVDSQGTRILPWSDRGGRLSEAMSWRRSLAVVYFTRADALVQIGNFDETLGPGSGTPWGSGEDNDLVLRAIESGLLIQYEPTLQINHPRLFPTFDGNGRDKRHSYSLGEGRLLRIHPMPLWWVMLFFLVPVVRSLVALGRFDLPEARFHWTTVSGRYQGFFATV